jgi:putative peptidoglycan lipid II flippase
MQDTRTPAIANVGVGCVNVAAALLYTAPPLELGVRGMALAHATSYVAGAGILLILLRKRLGALDGARIARTVALTSVAGIASAGAAVGVLRVWDLPAGAGVLSQAAHVLAAVAGGVLVFLISALILRVGEVDDLKKVIVRRFRG